MAQTTIPQEYTDLFTTNVVVGFVTLMPDGSPQVTPVWVDYVDGQVWINTARGRQKEENIDTRPQVAVLAIDPQNPYRWAEVRGTVVEQTEDGAVDHISKLSNRYRGTDYYVGANAANRDKETRIILKIAPTKVNARG